jgi:hypothetical protein
MQLHETSFRPAGSQKPGSHMGTTIHGLRVVFACAVLLLIASGAQGAQTPQKPSASETPNYEQHLVKSVFINNAGVGKDPFFPTSTRRGASRGPVISEGPVVPLLSLKGISGPKNHRLAIINNRTFEVGEEAELKFGGQSLRIRCIEIRDDGVTINVNGQNQKLLLDINRKPN